MIIKGYHTLENRDNYLQVEENGPGKCTDYRAWLGHGYYFWDSDIDLAHSWGENTYGVDRYYIFEGEIAINDETFDLYGRVAHKKELMAAYDAIIESGHLDEDSITVADIIEYLRKIGAFSYNSIRAADIPRRQFRIYFGGQRGEFMIANERVQVCLVIKKNLNLQSFRCIYPEEYLN